MDSTYDRTSGHYDANLKFSHFYLYTCQIVFELMPSAGIFVEDPSFHPNETIVERKGAYYMLNSNIRVISRAIQSLAKLGSDLYLEPTIQGLAMKSFNKTKSAYGIFLFDNDFFSEVDSSALLNLTTSSTLCRISMKCAMSIFKGVQFADNSYMTLKIWIEPKADTLTVEIVHNIDIAREFEIRVMESRAPFKTNVDKSSLLNVTVLSSAELMLLMNVMKGQGDDLIVSVKNEDEIVFKNFFPKDESSQNARLVKTEAHIKVLPDSVHRIENPCEIAFAMKDLVAAVSYAAQNDLPVSLYFDHAGKPLVVALEQDLHNTAEFIIATFESSVDEEDETIQMEVRTIHPSQNNASVQKSQPSERSIAETKNIVRNEPTSTMWRPPVADNGNEQPPGESDIFPTPEASAVIVTEPETRVPEEEPLGCEEVQQYDPEPIQNDYMDDLRCDVREDPDEDVFKEPAPKKNRDRDFRDFFLNFGQATQQPTQNMNVSALAYDSD